MRSIEIALLLFCVVVLSRSHSYCGKIPLLLMLSVLEINWPSKISQRFDRISLVAMDPKYIESPFLIRPFHGATFPA